MKIKKSKILKKEKGFLDDFLPMFAFILLTAVLLFFFIEIHSAINKKADLNAIARQYMLKMETQGCFKSEDITNLVKSLNDAGFRGDDKGSELQIDSFKKNNCDYTGEGHEGQSAGYGNDVEFSFTVYTEQWGMSDADIWTGFFQKTYKPITIEYHSTSKE